MTPAGGSAPVWHQTFAPFGLTHLLVVLVSVALIIVACRWGTARAGTALERRVRRTWVLLIVSTQLLHGSYWFHPDRFDIAASLPLQMCDLAPWVAAAALLWPRRWLRTLLYFWGIGLSTQAFFTPVLTNGVGTLHFWLFWMTHLQIVGSAIYDVYARGYRPTGRDYAFVFVANLVYAGVVTIVNLSIGANYGYIGDSTPDARTLMDALGPWPVRIVWVVLIIQVGMAAMWLVWPAARRLRARTSPSPGA